MTVDEAMEAYEMAADELRHLTDPDEIGEVANLWYWGFDEQGNYTQDATYAAERERGLTREQAELAQRICLSEYEKAIGRC